MAAPFNTFNFGSQAANAPPASTFAFGAAAPAPQAPQPAPTFTSLFGQPAVQPQAAAAAPQPQPGAAQSLTSLFGQPVVRPPAAPAAPAAPQSQPGTTLFGQPVAPLTDVAGPAWAQQAMPPTAAPTNPFGFGASTAATPAATAIPALPPAAAGSKPVRPAMLFGKPVGPPGAVGDSAGQAGTAQAAQAGIPRPATAAGRLFGAALAGQKFPSKDAKAGAAGAGADAAGGAAGGPKAGSKSGSKVWQRLAPADQGAGLGSQIAAASASGRPKTPWGRLARVENGSAANETKPAATFAFGQQQAQQGLVGTGRQDAGMASPSNGSMMDEDGGNNNNQANMPAAKQEGWGLGRLAAVSKALLSGGRTGQGSSSGQPSGQAPNGSQQDDELQRARQAAMKAMLSNMKSSGAKQKAADASEAGPQAAPQIWGTARGKKNAKAGGRGKNRPGQAAVVTTEEEDVDEEELKQRALAQMPSFRGAAGTSSGAGKKQQNVKSRPASDVDDEEQMKHRALASMPTFQGAGGPKFGGAAKKAPAPVSVSHGEDEEGFDEEEMKRQALAAMPGFVGGPSKPRATKPSPRADTDDEETRMRQQALESMPAFAGRPGKPAETRKARRRSPSPTPVAPAAGGLDDEDLEGGIVGTCDDMCPPEEVEQRKQSGQIDPFEMRGNNLVCVKKAQRNFDANMQQPHLFRTMVGLDKSMRYLRKLLDENALSPGSNPADFLRAYNFLWDRYRSVRKDVTTQAFHKSADKLQQVLEWNEEVARFLILADHELCSIDKLYTPDKPTNEPQSITDLNAALQVSKYDAHLNSEQLNKTLTDLNTFYDQAKLLGVPCPNEPEFRAYFVMLSAHTHGQFGKTPGQLESYNMKQSDLILSAPVYRLALEVVARMREGNWRGFFNAVLRAPPLLACLASLYFTSMRHVAMKVITASYTMGSRDLHIEVDEMMDTLCLTAEVELEQLCSSHGLDIEGDYVVFNKRTMENPNLMTLQKEVQRLTSALVQKKYEHLPWSRIVTESLPPSLLPHPSAAAHLLASQPSLSAPSPALSKPSQLPAQQPAPRVSTADGASKPPRSRIVFTQPAAPHAGLIAREEEATEQGDKTLSPLRKRSAPSTAAAPKFEPPTAAPPSLSQFRSPAPVIPQPAQLRPQLRPSFQADVSQTIPQVGVSAGSLPLRPLQLPVLSPAHSVDMLDANESPASARLAKRAVPPEMVVPSPRTAAELARQRQEQLLRQQQLIWEQEMARRREEQQVRMEKEAEEKRLAQEMQALEERARAYFLEKRVRRAVQRWRAALAAKKEELRRRQEASRARCKVSLGIQVAPVQTSQKRSYADVATAAAWQEQVKRSRASASKMWQALGQDRQAASVVPVIGGALSARVPSYPFLCCQLGVWTGLLDAKAGQVVETLQLGLGDWLRAKLSNPPPQGQTYPQVQAGELLTNFSAGGHNKLGRPTRLALSILEICSSQLPLTSTAGTADAKHPLQACQGLLLSSAVESQMADSTFHPGMQPSQTSNINPPPMTLTTGSVSSAQAHSFTFHTAGGNYAHGTRLFSRHSDRRQQSGSGAGHGQTSYDACRLLDVITGACSTWSASRPPPVAVMSSRPPADVSNLKQELEEGLAAQGVRERVGPVRVLSVHVKQAGAATAVLESALRFLVQHMPLPPALVPQPLYQLVQSFLQPHLDFLATKPPAPHLLIHAFNKAVTAAAHHIHAWITNPTDGFPHFHLPCPQMVPPDNACFLPDQLQAAVSALQQWHLPDYPTPAADSSSSHSHVGYKQAGFGAGRSTSSSPLMPPAGSSSGAGLLTARSYVSTLIRRWPAGSALGPLMQKLESAASNLSASALGSSASASPTQGTSFVQEVGVSEHHVVQELIVLALEGLAAHHTTAVLVPPVTYNPGLLQLSREWSHLTSSTPHVPAQQTQLVQDEALLLPSATHSNAAQPPHTEFSALSPGLQSPVQVTVLPPRTSPVEVTVSGGPSPATQNNNPAVQYTVVSPGQEQQQQQSADEPRMAAGRSAFPLSVADQALNIKLAWTRSSLNKTLQKVMLSVMEGTQLSQQYNDVLGRLGKNESGT